MVTWDEWANNVNEQLRTITKAIDDLVNSSRSIRELVNEMAPEIQVQSLRTDLSALEEELVKAIFLEKMQAHIVESLRTKELTQREIMKALPDFMENRLHRNAFDMAWTEFEKAGVILPISHGHGHARTWQLSLVKRG